MTAIPAPQDRGAFMSINSATMQISGGIATVIAGQVVGQSATGMILNYDTLGYVVVGTMTLMIGMMYYINRNVNEAHGATQEPTMQAATEAELVEEIA